MEPATDNPLTMPAGRVLGVIVIALAIAALFNSEAMVRAGESMKRGQHPRHRAVGRPPARRRGRRGRPAPPARGPRPRLRAGEQDRARAPSSRAARPRSCAPTGASKQQRASPSPRRRTPLDVFVTGDSEAQFVGEVLTDLLPSGLFDVESVARNATGLTNPEFFNWEINAAAGDRRSRPRRGRDGDRRQRRVQRRSPTASSTDPGDPQWQTSTRAAPRW